ncbi:MAG: hypothetical protein CMC70_10135 [Flavobacteriaceae bacterium]|nr:hypothetical protein [Flavobacteriaceae bacterium]
MIPEIHIKIPLYIIIVIGVVLLLLLITRFLNKWLVRKIGSQYLNEENTTIKLISHILKILWIVLSISCIFYLIIIFFSAPFNKSINIKALLNRKFYIVIPKRKRVQLYGK